MACGSVKNQCNKCGKDFMANYEPVCPACRKADCDSPQLSDVRELVKFCDWILNSKISLCDKRCLMQDIDTEFGNIKSNYCERESCPDLVLKLLLDSVRAHF